MATAIALLTGATAVHAQSGTAPAVGQNQQPAQQSGDVFGQGQPPLRQTAQPFGQGQPFGQAQPFGQGQPMGQAPVQRQLPAGGGAPQQGAAVGGGGLGLNPGCEKFGTFIGERKSLFEWVNNAVKGGKKMDASAACTTFGKIIRNGDETMKWMTANQAWCAIPPNVFTAIKNDNEKVSNIRGQACKAAAQIEAMKKNGGAQQQQFGGNGLTGEMKIPSGAL